MPTLLEQIRLASDPLTPRDDLEMLFNQEEPEIDRVLAANPNLSLETLLELADDWAAEVANNPATEMYHLAGELPMTAEGLGVLLFDGTLDLWVISASDLAPKDIDKLVSYPEIDRRLMDRWYRDPRAEVRVSAAQSWSLTRKQAMALSLDPDPDVRLQIAGNVHIDFDIHESMIATADADILLKLLRQKMSTAARDRAYDRLFEVGSLSHLASLARRSDMPPEIYRRLRAKKDVQIDLKLLGNDFTPIDMLRSLAAMYDQDDQALMMMVDNPAMPTDLLDLIPLDLEPEELLNNPNLSRKRMEEVISSGEEDHVRYLSTNSSLPPDLQDRLVSEYPLYTWKHLLKNDVTTSETLEKIYAFIPQLEDSEQTTAMEHLCDHEHLPEHLIQYFYHADDLHGLSHDEIVAILASNPATPDDLLSEIVRSDNVSILHNLIRNPRAGLHRLQILAHNPDRRIRRGLIMRSGVPREILEIMLHDPDPRFRRIAEIKLTDLHRPKP
jgi:hypothetical protein